MKKTVQAVIKFILAYMTTISIAGVSGYGITGIEIMLPCVFVLAFLVYHKAYERYCSFLSEEVKRKALKRDICASLPVGVILAAGITVGSHYDIWNQTITSIGAADLIYLIMLSLFFGSAVYILFGMLDKAADSKKAEDTEKKTVESVEKQTFGGKKYLFSTLVMLICWLPYYLTLLPGNMGADTFEEINMCLGNAPWTNHHPIFYTMLIGMVIKLTSCFNSLTVSIAVLATMQMIVFAITLTYIVRWLWNRIGDVKSAGRGCLIALAFFALFPVMPMFSIYLSKDVLFSCALVMLTLDLFDLIRVTANATADRKLLIRISVWSLLTMLLRNNGMMIVIITAVVLITAIRKNAGRLAISFALAVIVFLLFRVSAYNILNVEGQSFAESASIPLQQTGYVIANSEGDMLEDLSAEENEILANIMPYDRVREVYELGYTDMLKFDEEFDDEYFNEHSGEYMKIWLRLLPAHFADYVKAYLAQTAGYWHYGESNTLCSMGVTENSLGIAGVDVIKSIVGVSAWGLIEKVMLVVRKAPIICILTSMAMQIYMVLLLVSNYYRRKKGRQIIALMPVILLWVTIMMATPAFCLFRYTFALFLLWPVLISELFEQ